MKLFFILISMLLPISVMAQSVWEKPAGAEELESQDKQDKPSEDAKYLSGAVPEVDGKVYFFSAEPVEYGKFYRVKITKSDDYDLYGVRE